MMKLRKIFYKEIQLSSGKWHWQVQYADGTPVVTSAEGYARRFDARIGCDRIWGRPLIYLQPDEKKPPAASMARKAKAAKRRRSR